MAPSMVLLPHLPISLSSFNVRRHRRSLPSSRSFSRSRVCVSVRSSRSTPSGMSRCTSCSTSVSGLCRWRSRVQRRSRPRSRPCVVVASVVHDSPSSSRSDDASQSGGSHAGSQETETVSYSFGSSATYYPSPCSREFREQSSDLPSSQLSVSGDDLCSDDGSETVGTSMENTTLKTRYVDGAIDLAIIALFNSKLENAVNSHEKIDPNVKGYARLVAIADCIGQQRTIPQQHRLVVDTLLSLIPPVVRKLFKLIFPPSQFIDEMMAWTTVRAFAWLVGPCEAVPREGDGALAAVELKKCRYLEESGCTGSCINFCKLPTQQFFEEAFGVDVTLTPDVEEGTCVMTFGQKAPADDPSLLSACVATCPRRAGAGDCSSASSETTSCPLLKAQADL